MLYVVLSWFQEIYTFYMQLFLQSVLSTAQNVNAWLKKHALKLFQYTVVLFSLLTDSKWIVA